MKIHLDMTGRPLAKPDFAQLRAGLAAAQATTPTATANDKASTHLDLAEALMLQAARESPRVLTSPAPSVCP